jgi:hypothetical protein
MFGDTTRSAPNTRAACLSGRPPSDEKEAGTVVNFLAEMEAVVQWSRLHQLMVAHYIKASPKSGRPPTLMDTMLPVDFPDAVVCLMRVAGAGDAERQ